MDICIPEDNAMEMLRSYHFMNVHPGVEKFFGGLKLRYKFPDGCSVREMVIRVEGFCSMSGMQTSQ